MAHGVHGVVRLVAVDRPVALVFGIELVGAHGADRDVDADLRPARFRPHPATVRAGHLEIIAMHVDRVVGHGEIANPHPHPVVLRDDEWIDPGEHAAVPGPQIEVGHRHDLRHVGARIDIIGVEKEHKSRSTRMNFGSFG